MLIIVTGLPGAGKTLYALAKLLPQYRGRKVFVEGIPSIDHEYFGTQELKDPDKWYDVPEASVVLMDEAQRVFPVRHAGSKVPRKCSEFETHRHKGLDIVLLTQDATLLDVHLRKLCGKHIHVHRLFGSETSNIYEYGEFQKLPADTNSRKMALHTASFKFPKEIFDHYKSADAHTVKRKLPKKLFILPLCLVGIIAAAWFAVHAIGNLTGNADVFADDLKSEISSSSPSPYRSGGPRSGLDVAASFLPAVDGLPWTAPAYAGVMQVRTFPKPHCIIVIRSEGDDQCLCYTQQVTKMQGVPRDVCLDIASNGWFDFTRADARTRDSAKRGADRARDRDSEDAKPGDSLH